MSTIHKYDPEDIESLLLHKQFHELYPEEKEFVLRHVAGQEEYESLRQTLILMHDANDPADWLEPDPSIKRNLMAEFAGEKKKGFWIWLNTLFTIPSLPEVQWYQRPAFRVALAGVAVLIIAGTGLWVFNQNDSSSPMAELVNKDVTNPSQNERDTVVLDGNQREFAENLRRDEFPPAPPVVSEMIVTELTVNEEMVNYYVTAGDDIELSADQVEAPKPAEAPSVANLDSEDEKAEEISSTDANLDRKQQLKGEVTMEQKNYRSVTPNAKDAIASESIKFKSNELATASVSVKSNKGMLDVLFTAK